MIRPLTILAALLAWQVGCSSSSSSPGSTSTTNDLDAGQAIDGRTGVDATTSSDQDGATATNTSDATAAIGDGASGPQLMVRIANMLYPTFHDFDVCLGTGDSTPTYTEPLARNVYQGLHLAQYASVGPYLSAPAGVTWARLVEVGTSSCDDVIADIPDVKLDAPLAADTWVTLLASGDVDPADGEVASPLKIDALLDQAFSSTDVYLRVLSFDPDVTSLKVGYVDSNVFNLIVDDVTYGPPGSGYVMTTEHGFCDGLTVEAEDGGAIGGLGQLCTQTGGWTMLIPPPKKGGIVGCQDGVAGPRLCVPCGLQTCTGA